MGDPRREKPVWKPSWPSSTSFSIGTNRVRDKVEWYTDKRFNRFLVRGGPRYFASHLFRLHRFSHSLSPLPPTVLPLVLPREPDVASTLANQLATRMRPPRLNFNVPEDSIHRHAVSSLLTIRVRVSSIPEKPSSLIYVPPASISNRFLVAWKFVARIRAWMLDDNVEESIEIESRLSGVETQTVYLATLFSGYEREKEIGEKKFWEVVDFVCSCERQCFLRVKAGL